MERDITNGSGVKGEVSSMKQQSDRAAGEEAASAYACTFMIGPTSVTWIGLIRMMADMREHIWSRLCWRARSITWQTLRRR